MLTSFCIYDSDSIKKGGKNMTQLNNWVEEIKKTQSFKRNHLS